MRENRKGIVLAAAVGIALLGCMAAGLFLIGGGARAGHAYIEGGFQAGAEDGKGRTVGTGAGPEDGILKEAESMGGNGTGMEDAFRGQAEDGKAENGQAEDRDGHNGMAASADNHEATAPASPEVVMLFAGDVYFSDHVLNAYDKAGGIHGVLDGGIRAEIEDADIFMVNQEFPFTRRGTAAADKQFTFRLPESRMHLLQEMGVDIVTLANNHILDFGTEGLLDSCRALDEAGILYVGGGEDLDRASALQTITVGQKTIGFLGTSRVYMDAGWAAGNSHPGVFSTYDTALPLKVIEEARQQCDYLVVYVHWGVERETTPMDYQRDMGRAYIDAGADLVVGSHPHVLQETEEYKGKTIVYSLGNFVFGSSIPQTALLKVVWGQEEAKVSMIPCTSSGGYTRLAQ